MSDVFVDTSFLIALVINDDAHHVRALNCQNLVQGSLVTTEYVLMEFVDALSRPSHRLLAVSTVGVFRNRGGARVIPATSSLMDDGIRFFEKHKDKAWSLTDCISFVVMKQVGVFDALTSDHHFEQAGFRAMLRDSSGR